MSACANDYSRSTAFFAPSKRTLDPAGLDRHPSGRFASFPAGPATGGLAVRRVPAEVLRADLMTSAMVEATGLRGYPELLTPGRAEPRDSAARRLLQLYHLRDAPQGADEAHHDNLLLAGRPSSRRAIPRRSAPEQGATP